jgi:hypothetical protein
LVGFGTERTRQKRLLFAIGIGLRVQGAILSLTHWRASVKPFAKAV